MVWCQCDKFSVLSIPHTCTDIGSDLESAYNDSFTFFSEFEVCFF